MKRNINRVNEILEEFYKVFFKIEDNALKIGIKELTHNELHIIDAIGSSTFTMFELSEKLGTTMGTVTVAIAKLEKKKFVLRTRCSEDKRKVYVCLDEKGKDALKYHKDYHKKLLSSITPNISEEDLEKFTATLESILVNLKSKL
ncbi:MAG: MarR family winged helix-turn-helix transcriptional regulator [Fusobacteriaceae bacterium]